MKRIDSETVYEGRYSSVRLDTYRYEDGATSERETVVHPDAVGMLAYDSEHVWLVRQPREAVDEEALLEIPAGKLDVEGETPLECAKRELAEEIGKSAREWRELKTIYMTPGWADERMTLFVATGLDDAEGEADPGERIEVVRWPLADIDAAIEECRDAKSLIGLLLLRDSLR
jgi:ADP-ribose pyrophosphatase